MIDFEKARINMVDCQIRPSDVTSHEVLEAFGTVPREAFVSAAQKPLSYIDEDILLQDGSPPRYLMEAMSMSRLMQLAEITDACIVLDIGCATGYSTAILSRLCNSVVAVECDADLAERATANLLSLDFDNAAIVNGPLEAGYPSEGPYDAIFVGGAVDVMPEVLGQQLKDGGRMVVVEGTGNTGVARLYVRDGDVVSGRTVFNCAVRALPGFAVKPEFVF